MSNKEVIQDYYRDIINGKDFSLLDQYYHPDYLSGSLPYIGMGVGFDSSSGQKVLVNFVYPKGPSAGKLEVGDEVIYVQDGEVLLEGFDEMKDTAWGWGKTGSILKLGVLRQGEEIEVEITRGIVEGLKMPLDEFREIWEKNINEKTPDEKAQIWQILEEGDLVACLLTYTGTHLEYDRQYLVPGGVFYRLKDGKIIEDWAVGDNLAFYRQMGFSVEQPEK
jgi:predicted ester cyclase